jgi:hypothetical protein
MQIANDLRKMECSAVPTSFFIPTALHSRVKTVAGLKRVKMADIFIEGIQMALDSERFRLSEEERHLFTV